MARKAAHAAGTSGAGSALLSIVSRCLPAVLLPTLVASLQPDDGSGSMDLKLVMVAGASGVLITMTMPKLRFSLLAVAVLTLMLLSVAHLHVLKQELHHDDSIRQISHLSQGRPAEVTESAPATPQELPERKRTAAEMVHLLRWRPQHPKPEASVRMDTFSVVLPCAFEGEFAEKTVWAIWENTDQSKLKEIVVVDDGGQPPLRKQMSQRLLAGGPGVPPMKIVRHERTLGLISAKKSGGDASIGDVIVFFDCHVSPRKGWEEAFLKQMKRMGDHRTMVVPTITSLDPDTWKEIPGGGGGKACYVLFSNDFTWLHNPGRDAPLMSGGLLALTRKWWEETGGYDDKMVAWGGENIDQSLRSWLCGGRIEVAEGAYVAHMWRDAKKPKTQLRYPIPTADVMRNKARAAKGWFDEFAEKTMSFPEYEMFTKYGESIGDMGQFATIKKNLQCAPFTAYLNRFRYIYLDGGFIPEKVFQIRETKSGLCLERKNAHAQPHGVVMAPCAGTGETPAANELQLFHEGNRDISRPGKPCCSGIMHWNFLQCLDAQTMNTQVRTFECEVGGSSANQHFHLPFDSSDGQFLWRPENQKDGTSGCVGPMASKVGDAQIVPPESCSVVVEKAADSSELDDGSPSSFRLRSKLPGGGCGSVASSADAEDISGLALQFRPCDEEDPQQFFHAKSKFGGLEIHAGSTKNCFDSAGGGQILVYPCYQESVRNMNQIWKIQNGHLVWQQGNSPVACLSEKLVEQKASSSQGEYSLETCAVKPGQRLQKEKADEDTFNLKDADDGRCLAALSGNMLGLGPCTPQQRWRYAREQLMHIESGNCIDTGPYNGAGGKPILYPCHQGRVEQAQKLQLQNDPGWIRTPGSWSDNGRKRVFPLCLDRLPQATQVVAIQDCDLTRKKGVRWERLNAFVPLERRLWDAADKPPPDAPILGGDSEPP